MLAAAGWAVQDRKDLNLAAAPGVAVREFQTRGGPADYLLFLGNYLVGVIEAKKAGVTLTSVEIEEPRYRWDGRPAPARREEAEPEIRMEALSWVALTVVDDDEPGRPLPRLHFRMRLPDGATRTGALDGQGHALVEDVEPGRCWVELVEVRRGLTT